MELYDRLEVRPARAEDSGIIRRMVYRERLDPTQLRWLQFIVIESDERIVAVGQLRHLGGVQELGSLVVVPDWRGKGLGGMLIRALVAQRNGPLFLECRRSLSPYYERHGFRLINWWDVPWPLKVKFGISAVLGHFAGGVHAMRYEG